MCGCYHNIYIYIICIFVYICVYIYIYHMCIYIYIYTYMCIYIYMNRPSSWCADPDARPRRSRPVLITIIHYYRLS